MDPMRLLRLVCVLAASMSGLPLSAAPLLNFEGGVSFSDSYGTAAAFVESVFDAHRIGASRFHWAPDVSLGWIHGRNPGGCAQDSCSLHETVWLAAAGVRVSRDDPIDPRRRWFLSFQPALQRGRTEALSDNLEFVTTLGWQGRRFSVQLRHVSDAGIKGPNSGETMVLFGVAFEPLGPGSAP